MSVFDDMLETVADHGVLARPVERGEALPTQGHISLVLNGSVGLTIAQTGILVSLAGPGDIVGAEALGSASSALTGVWLTSGLVLQVRAQDLCGEGEMLPLVQWLADCFQRSQMALAQDVACRARHNNTERTANLLSQMCLDSRSLTLQITQQALAQLFGVQRTSICAAMEVFQARNFCTVRRGRIEVRDLAGLRAAACGCGSRQVFRGQEPRIVPTLFRKEPLFCGEQATQAALL